MCKFPREMPRRSLNFINYSDFVELLQSVDNQSGIKCDYHECLLLIENPRPLLIPFDQKPAKAFKCSQSGKIILRGGLVCRKKSKLGAVFLLLKVHAVLEAFW